MATPTIDPRIERPERRAEPDDETIHSLLRVLQRMDKRLAALEADVQGLKADTTALETDVDAFKTELASVTARTVDIAVGGRDHDVDEHRLLWLETSVDRRRPFAHSTSAGYEQTA